MTDSKTKKTLEVEISELEKSLTISEEKIKHLISQLKHKDDVIAMAYAEAERAKEETRSYANSTSWKITAPIRALINVFKR